MFKEMLEDLLDIAKEAAKNLASSRIFALSLIFTIMFCVLILKLFNLQIIEGDQHQDDYIQKTKKEVDIPSTRGNIYDRNGKILAYNELAYSVTIQDTGAYPKNADKNAMLLRLNEILESHGESVQGKFEISLSTNGDIVFTSSSELARKRFLRDLYGLRSVDDLDDEKGKYPSAVTARSIFEKKKQDYELDKLTDDKGNPIILTDAQALNIINIRYTMSFTEFKKYETTMISNHIGTETVADILEHSDALLGINVEEGTIRVYNDSIYFASIVGYTGKMPEDQLLELQKVNPGYVLNDIVGRTGIEAYMETQLQGKKGRRTMFVDNMGRTLEVTQEIEPKAGDDIYLTIDHDLQMGIYRILEQQLAGVLASKLVNQDDSVNAKLDGSSRKIPIRDAYYQLINNNVLSLAHMESEGAADIEKEINGKFLVSRDQLLANMRNELMSSQPTVMKDLPEDMYAYMSYAYSYLSDESVGIIQKNSINTNSAEYQAWKNDTISLREFIYSGIANNWIDSSKLDIKNKYSNADDTFNALVDYLLEHLKDDTAFTKKIYRYLVNNEVITGRELCLALYAQGVLVWDEEEVQKLSGGGSNYAFTFLKNKISDIEITPAQLALDPCTAGCVVTDVKTGEVRALVTYPSYDNNRMSGTVDGIYFSQLNEDQSRPLWNNATQVIKAPGSTFKPITAIAGLETGAISLTDRIVCTGHYDEVTPPIKCWLTSGHGSLDVVGGIQNSCNVFVADVAHRLSLDENSNYVSSAGIEKIRGYAAMFGLDDPSGVEIPERDPEMTNEAPERSAMGQGTHSYANIQLSRYVAALANRGTVFDLSLLDKETDSKGNLIEDFSPETYYQVDIADSTWNAVQTGMRGVITDGSAKAIFKDLEIDIAGKTGTAQESKTRANHAFFISYAPFSDPEICVTVNIPYGYSSSNAATVAKNVYRFYYEYTDLESIMSNGASDVSNIKIVD